MAKVIVIDCNDFVTASGTRPSSGIPDESFIIKAALISQVNVTGCNIAHPRVFFNGRNVYIKNTYTNLLESIGANYVSMNEGNDIELVTAELVEMKGLNVTSQSPWKWDQHGEPYLSLSAANKFFAVFGNTAYVYTVTSVSTHSEPLIKLYDVPRSAIMSNVRQHVITITQWDNKSTDVKSDDVTPADVKPDDVKSDDVKSKDTKSEDIKTNNTYSDETCPADKLMTRSENMLASSIIRSSLGTLDKSLPMLESTTVYGIQVWRPAQFIKRRAMFNIYLEKGKDVRVFVVNRGIAGFTITPHQINNITNSVRISFNSGLYAIGFTDSANENCIEPPITDIEMHVPPK